MREYADRVAQDKLKLDDQIRILTEQQNERDKTKNSNPLDSRLAEAQGMAIAADIIGKRLRKTTGKGFVPHGVLVNVLFESVEEISGEIEKRTADLKPSKSREQS